MWLSFEALDVWFFRDGRPFDAGDAHVARSQFPPPPETMLGAIRAILLEDRFQAPRSDGLSVEGYLAWLRQLPKDLPTDDTSSLSGEPAYVATYTEFGAGTTPGSDLALTGPFVVVGERGAIEEIATAAPRDLLKQEVSHDLVTLNPLVGGAGADTHPLPGVSWNRGLPVSEHNGANAASPPTPLPLVSRATGVEDVKGATWITFPALLTYLNGGLAASSALPPFHHERRSGIAIGDDRIVRIGYYYEIEVVRPQTSRGRTRLLARVFPDPERGTAWRLPLGGEGKTALARRADGDPAAVAMERLLDPKSQDAVEARRRASETGWLRVVLLQPAIFRRGWLPDGVDGRGILKVGKVGSHKLSLQAAAMGKPQAISGWDLRTNQAKPLRYAAPAGSVFFFKIEASDAPGRDSAAAAFWETHHGKTALQEDKATGRAGYGLAVVGACAPEEVPAV